MRGWLPQPSLGLVAIASVAVVVLAGCSGAATQKSPSITNIAPPRASHVHLWHPGMTQLGIDLLWYTYASQSMASIAKDAITDMNYIVGLGANSVDIVFPVYTGNIESNSLLAGSGTPTTTQLAIVVQAALTAGLRVMLRPLMDQGSLLPSWRGAIEPSNVPAWFTSYEQFLQPYLVMAQANGVTTFDVGAEFTSLEAEPEWAQLVSQARTVFSGQLAYSANFDTFHAGDPMPPVDRLGVDDYAPVELSDTAALAQVENAWDAWWETTPTSISLSQVVIDEMDIAAQDGAYQKPFATNLPGAPLNLAIQSTWFTAACQTVQQFRLAGIYFWAVNLGSSLTEATSPGSFIGRPGAGAISSCFASFAGTP
jgi:hypothetical protein